MASFDAALGRAIAAERTRLGLSQERLAHRAKLHATYVSQLERGLKSPTIRALKAICQGLGISVSEVVGRAEKASARVGR